MHLEIYQLWMLVGGAAFAIFGGLIVFSNKFFSWIETTWWKNTPADEKLFSGRSGYLFDRYGRGLGSFILGILMLASLLGSIWKPILPLLAIVVWPAQFLSTSDGKLFVGMLLLVAVYVLLRNSSNKPIKNKSEADTNNE